MYFLSGFGFVTFQSEDVVDKVCEIHFHEINNKMVSRQSKKSIHRTKSVPFTLSVRRGRIKRYLPSAPCLQHRAELIFHITEKVFPLYAFDTHVEYTCESSCVYKRLEELTVDSLVREKLSVYLLLQRKALSRVG